MIDDTEVDQRARLTRTGGKTVLLDEIRAISKHLEVIDAQLPGQHQWVEAIQGLHEPMGHIRTAHREIRGELAGIRARLDSLVAIEKQLSYQGQRLSAIEKRFATLVETKLSGTPPWPPLAKGGMGGCRPLARIPRPPRLDRRHRVQDVRCRGGGVSRPSVGEGNPHPPCGTPTYPPPSNGGGSRPRSAQGRRSAARPTSARLALM